MSITNNLFLYSVDLKITNKFGKEQAKYISVQSDIPRSYFPSIVTFNQF